MPLFLIAAWSPMLLQQPQLCVLTRVEVAKKQQQQGLCCRGRQGPPPGFPSPRPHWSRPVLPGWVAADTAGGGTSAILRSAKSPLSRSAGPNRGEFELQLMRAKHRP